MFCHIFNALDDELISLSDLDCNIVFYAVCDWGCGFYYAVIFVKLFIQNESDFSTKWQVDGSDWADIGSNSSTFNGWNFVGLGPVNVLALCLASAMFST